MIASVSLHSPNRNKRGVSYYSEFEAVPMRLTHQVPRLASSPQVTPLQAKLAGWTHLELRNSSLRTRLRIH